METRMNDATLVTVAGRDPERQHGAVNPAVYHASTILFPSVAALEAARPRHGITYGRSGPPPPVALEGAIAKRGGGPRSIVRGSGKTPIPSMLLAPLRTGDPLLMVDTVYAPPRHFCTG